MPRLSLSLSLMIIEWCSSVNKSIVSRKLGTTASNASSSSVFLSLFSETFRFGKRFEVPEVTSFLLAINPLILGFTLYQYRPYIHFAFIIGLDRQFGMRMSRFSSERYRRPRSSVAIATGHYRGVIWSLSLPLLKKMSGYFYLSLML